MSIFDQQMRSLTVAPVYIDAPRTKIPEIFPQSSSKLLSLFTTKKSAASFSVPKDEYLLILTCDRLAILKGDPANEGSVHGGVGAASGSTTATGTTTTSEPPNPPFVSIPLSLLKGAHAEGSTLIIEHYLPTQGHHSKQPSSSSPTGGSGITTTTSSHGLSSSISSASSASDDSTFSFPLISASVAAISKLRRGDTPGTGQSTLRLHTDSTETANELAKAVHTALQRLLNALLWLDRGLPLEAESSLAVSTVSLAHQDDKEVLLTRAPAWGSTVKLPSPSSSDGGSSSGALASIHIDVCTPLGPCHAVIPVRKLLSLPAGEELTVAAVCSSDAQDAAGSLNLSASVTIGNVVVATTKSTLPTAAAAASITTGGQQAGTDVFFAGCIGAALALLVATVFSGLTIDLPLALVGATLFAVMLFLQKKKNSSNSLNSNSSGNAATAAGTSQQQQQQKGIKFVESFSLLHAEIIEGPEEDLTTVTETTTTTTQQQPQKLARQLTASLARRDSYLQRTTSITPTSATTTASFARLKSSTKAQQQPGTAGTAGTGLVDIGAVSLRRVVSRSVAGTTSFVREHHLEMHAGTATMKIQPTKTMESRHEAEVLEKLHAISPAITQALFERYITACGGDRKKALTRLKITAEWRANNAVDEILTSPVPRFKPIKAAYLHSVIGWTKDKSMPVVVEGMGAFKKALIQLHKDDITPAEMIQQFVFVLEWVLNDLTKDKSGSFVRIYDLKGISLFDLADKQAIALGQQMMDLLEKYYPERMAKAFVVNTPSFFATAWKMVKPMLDPRTAQKIQVLSGTPQTFSALSEIMDDDVIPVAYGGKNPITGYEIGFEGGWYEGAIEKQLSALADELNSSG
jgi:hypothetical protein